MVDDYSRFMWIAFLTTKDEAEMAIMRIKAAAEVQSGCILRTLRTDKGGEFNSRSFSATSQVLRTSGASSVAAQAGLNLWATATPIMPAI
jgi:hypothetical protein